MKIIYLEEFVSWIFNQPIEIKKEFQIEKMQFKITKDGIKYAVLID